MIVYHFTRVGYSVVGSDFPHVGYVSVCIHVPTSTTHLTQNPHVYHSRNLD